jgi:hypothetical protein
MLLCSTSTRLDMITKNLCETYSAQGKGGNVAGRYEAFLKNPPNTFKKNRNSDMIHISSPPASRLSREKLSCNLSIRESLKKNPIVVHASWHERDSGVITPVLRRFVQRPTVFLQCWSLDTTGLKVLTNEKRGGLTEVSFDRSGFKLFSL